MSRTHAYHHMCGCAQCCRTERAMERDDEMREMYRDDLTACPDFIAELALSDQEAEQAAQALSGNDLLELGRIVAAALERTADELIATRADESGITPGEAAERMFEVYRPDALTNGDHYRGKAA